MHLAMVVSRSCVREPYAWLCQATLSSPPGKSGKCFFRGSAKTGSIGTHNRAPSQEIVVLASGPVASGE